MNQGTGSNNIIIGVNLMLHAIGTAILGWADNEIYNVNTPSAMADYHQLASNSWDSTFELSETDVFNGANSLQTFTENLLNNSMDIDPEILEVVNKNFWDLL